jgi:hypothetical protein
MSETQISRIQDLLAAKTSPLRDELLGMGFDALAAQPLSILFGHPELAGLIVRSMDRGNVELVTQRHVLPAVARVQARLSRSHEELKDFLPKDAQDSLRALVAHGKGPRFAWLRGAVDPGDLQKLISPIVQQVLTSFVAKLPIPGLSGSGRAETPSTRPPSSGGLVGMIGKQVARGASQLAGGLGLQQIVRDFSQSAALEIRQAVIDRLKSDEGRAILARIRARVLDRILHTKATRIVDDLLRVSPSEVARIAEGAVSHTRELQLFRDILEGELRATLEQLGTRSLADVLAEAHLLEPVRGLALAAVEPAIVDLVKTDGFAQWLEKLLASSAP